MIQQQAAIVMVFLTIAIETAADTLSSRFMAQQSVKITAPTVKLEGHHDQLVVLVEFADKYFDPSHNAVFYEEMLNGLGDNTRAEGLVGCVRDYFLAQSNGKFDVQFDVVGPVRLAREYSYYGQDSTVIDYNVGELAEELVNLTRDKVDFSRYDWDNDGIVEQIVFIYSGYGQNVCFGKYPETIWPKKSNLVYYGKQPIEANGYKINNFACSPELRMTKEDGTHQTNGIGTFCHEYAHCLGLPDMYDGNGVFYGTSVWDLMGTGVHNNNGITPAGLTGYEKMLLGWQTPIILSADSLVLNVAPLSHGGDIFKIQNDNDENEYYLLENRQQTGWDAGIPGHGLLVLHINHDEQVISYNKVNSSDNDFPHCKIVLADNDSTPKSRKGDVFPFNNNDSLTSKSVPASKTYHRNIDGSLYMGKYLSNIEENNDGTVNFTFTNALSKSDEYMLYAEVERHRYLSDSSVTIRVNVSNNSKGKTYTRPIGAYVYSKNRLQSPRAFETCNINVGETSSYDFTLTGLSDTTNYEVRLFYYPNDTTLWWKQMSDGYVFDMKDRFDYVLSANEDYDLLILSSSSISLEVTIHNESFHTYNRPLGVYVKHDGTLQESRTFNDMPNIAPYDDKRFHFELDKLIQDTDYEVSVYYYPNDTTYNWLMAGGPYHFRIDNNDLSIKNNQCWEESYSVYSISGLFVGRNVDMKKLSGGMYIMMYYDGRVKKRAVK